MINGTITECQKNIVMGSIHGVQWTINKRVHLNLSDYGH